MRHGVAGRKLGVTSTHRQAMFRNLAHALLTLRRLDDAAVHFGEGARLKPDFRSSNWASITQPHAVAGHPFGLRLAPADRTALIAFLRTL